jgi:hypothetical protein
VARRGKSSPPSSFNYYSIKQRTRDVGQHRCIPGRKRSRYRLATLEQTCGIGLEYRSGGEPASWTELRGIIMKGNKVRDITMAMAAKYHSDLHFSTKILEMQFDVHIT